jgi:hypothetical protein
MTYNNNTMNIKTQLRQTLIALLDDQDGISDQGYVALQALEATVANGSCDDIFARVESTDGRFYLPEDHGLSDTLGENATEDSGHQFVDCGGHPRCAICGCDEDDAFVGGQACSGKE